MVMFRATVRTDTARTQAVLRAGRRNMKGEILKSGRKAGLWVVNYSKARHLSGQRLRAPTGRLRNSIFSVAAWTRGRLVVRIGSHGKAFRYARIHEFGGRIKPKRAKALAIPLPGYEGRKPRSMALQFVPHPKRTAHGFMVGLLFHVYTPAFILMAWVDVPEKRYIRDSAKALRGPILEEFRDVGRRAFSTGRAA